MTTGFNQSAPPSSPRTRWRLMLLIAFALLVLTAGLSVWFETRFGVWISDEIDMALAALDAVLKWSGIMDIAPFLRSLGALGVVLGIAIYALGVSVAAPASLMSIALTLTYGYWAIAISWAGATLGLTLTFFIARRFFRRHVDWFCSRYPVTRGIEKALDNNGFWLVFLMRQSPILPFAPQNYLFGMLNVSARDYLIASALGIIPGTIAKIFIIESARASTTSGASWLQFGLAAVGIGATIAIMAWIGRYVRRELDAQTG